MLMDAALPILILGVSLLMPFFLFPAQEIESNQSQHHEDEEGGTQ
ncbi:MAG: hypothetical protein RIQ54_556 [Candidatus Parcubacteria bacterium]|jgi:hypothetical protein